MAKTISRSPNSAMLFPFNYDEMEHALNNNHDDAAALQRRQEIKIAESTGVLTPELRWDQCINYLCSECLTLAVPYSADTIDEYIFLGINNRIWAGAQMFPNLRIQCDITTA